MPGDWPLAPGPWLALVCAAAAYGIGVRSLRRRRRPWNPWRTVSYGAGLLAIASALVSPLAARDEHFNVHMLQHLLLGMLGPVLLALSAPITLALRTLPTSARRGLVSVLHSRAVALLAHPMTATVVFVAGIVGLYFTPLYDQTVDHPLLHEAVHLHVLLAGCLFAWTFIGTDPVPQRGSFALRAGLLLFALGSHAALAKLLYAGYGDVHAATPQELRDGALLMYYAGDGVDLIILVAFFGQWYIAGGRRLERDRRRAALSA
jgi:putative membrane protein